MLTLLLTYLRPPPARPLATRDVDTHTAPPPPSLRSPVHAHARPNAPPLPEGRAEWRVATNAYRAYEDPNRPHLRVLAIGSSMLHTTPLTLIVGLPVRGPVLHRGAPEPHAVYTYLHVLYSSMCAHACTHARRTRRRSRSRFRSRCCGVVLCPGPGPVTVAGPGDMQCMYIYI